MNEPPRGQPRELETEPDDLEITDLRATDQPRSPEFWPATSRRLGSHLPLRQVVQLGGALLALALALAVVLLLYGIRSGALVGRDTAPIAVTPPLPTPVVRYPDLHGLQCLRDDTWSPDSRYFAYAGNSSQGCGYGDYSPNLINIYRAQDGAFVRQLAPDPAIFAALSSMPPPTTPPYATPVPGAPILMYDFLLWSRDGQRFAVVFVLNEDNRTLLGLAVVRAQDGGVERVALGNAPPDNVLANSYTVWDLGVGTASTYLDAPGSQSGGGQAAVPSYAWMAAGQLVPASTPSGAIGNPNGDAQFSMWQPGSVRLSTANVPDRPEQQGVYVYDEEVAAWSPDGRYVAAFLLASARVQPSRAPLPDAATLATLGAANLPLLLLRDLGLDQALHHIVTPMDLANGTNQSTAWIAYRPDGRALALLDDQQNFAVYAAGTGSALYPFRYLDLLPRTHNGSAWALRWSPDGTALLLPDGSALHVGRLGG